MTTALRVVLGALAVLSSVSVAGEASADPPARVDLFWSTAFDSPIKDMDVAVSSPLTHVSALNGFSLQYKAGEDHMVRRLGVLAKDKLASFAMSDQNGDDTYSAMASWTIVKAGKAGAVTAVGGGQFEIPLPAADKLPGHRLVLRGFEFRRKDKTDANIRSVGVWLDEKRNTARVMLMDDQGPDFRGFEQTVGMAMLAGAVLPFGQISASSTITMNDAVQRLNLGEKAGKYRPYAVTVQYGWIPEATVEKSEVMTGVSNFPGSGKIIERMSAIQGFEFYFTNSDHHLGAIWICNPGTTYCGKTIKQGQGSVEFRDKNSDDHRKWALSFLTLKPVR